MSINVDNMATNSGDVTDDDKLWALLGYIFGLIALIALLMEDKKNRPFVKYHAVHALAIALLVVITSWTICGWAIPWLYGLYLGFQAYKGEWVVVPVITDFVKKQGWV